MVRVLFVCLGNICRSPTAEGIFRAMVAEAGLAESIEVESAGTAAYHIGDGADPRSVRAARDRGYDLSRHRARQVHGADFETFDYVLAMDHENLRELESMRELRAVRRAQAQAPEAGRQLAQVSLLLDFAPQLQVREVPDPYYRRHDGFDIVIDMVEDAARGLLEHIRSRHP
ncbi:MAG: low molecular weight phosphotyrosine protein phosphatase [Deltaproteobacteria bacterium]|nr:low molecular weight phosphotyrosine protein phosphatase [Deltaproteobacteria bacterium]